MDIPARRPTYAYLFGPLGLELWRVETNGRSRYAYRFFDQEWGREPVFEADDFRKEFTPELRAKEERLRAEVERQRSS